MGRRTDKQTNKHKVEDNARPLEGTKRAINARNRNKELRIIHVPIDARRFRAFSHTGR